jgi:hypothetical protein
MKHKQYEKWILDGEILTAKKEAELASHITLCEECARLQSSWMVSKNLLETAIEKAPKEGFANRWQETILRKQRVEKIRQYRLALFGLLMLSFLSALVFLIASGSIGQMLATTLNGIAHFLISITNGLSTFGYWIRRLPVYIPLTAGFILFGLVNAFLMAGVFMLWNLKNRKKLVYETAAK